MFSVIPKGKNIYFTNDRVAKLNQTGEGSCFSFTSNSFSWAVQPSADRTGARREGKELA